MSRSTSARFTPFAGRHRVALVGLCVVVLVLAGLGAWGWRAVTGPDSRLAVALESAPAGTERVAWTDWSAVRRDLDVEATDGGTATQAQRIAARGFGADLTSASLLVDAPAQLHRTLGLSPASADWELLAQSPAGAVSVTRLTGGTGRVEDRLAGHGYTNTDGVYAAGPGAAAAVLSPTLQYVAVVPDEQLVLASDRESYLRSALTVAEGQAEGLSALTEAAEAAGDPLNAVLFANGRGCASLGMAEAASEDQRLAERLIDDAGGVHPVDGTVIAQPEPGRVRVVLTFETEEQATADLQARTALAEGPAAGLGGEYADRFRVEEATAEGTRVTLDLRAVDDYVFSDLSTGPTLFASC